MSATSEETEPANPLGTDGFEFVEYTAPDTAHLGRLFEGGRLMLTPQDGRTYLARGRLDLGRFLTMRFEVERTAAEGDAGWATRSRNFSWSSNGCAGRI